MTKPRRVESGAREQVTITPRSDRPPQHDTRAICQAVAIIALLYTLVQRSLFSVGISIDSSLTHTLDSVLSALHAPTLAVATGIVLAGRRAPGSRAGRSLSLLGYAYGVWFPVEAAIRVLAQPLVSRVPQLSEVLLAPVVPWGHFDLLHGLLVSCLALLLLPARWLQVLCIPLGAVMFRAQDILAEFPGLGSAAPLFLFVTLGHLSQQVHWPNPLARLPVGGPYLVVASAVLANLVFHAVLGRETYAHDAAAACLSLLDVGALWALGSLLARAPFATALVRIGNAWPVFYGMAGILSNGTRLALAQGLKLESPGVHVALGFATSFGVPAALVWLGARTGRWSPSLLPTWWDRAARALARSVERVLARRVSRWAFHLAWSVPFLAITTVYAASSYQLFRPAKRPPTAKLALSQDSAVLEEGRRLARVYGCLMGCHDSQMQGGMRFDVPGLGVFTSPNLTEAFARRSPEQIDALVRYGVRFDGSRLLAAMPSSQFSHITDDEASAIYSFIRSVEPQSNQPASSAVSLRGRLALARRQVTTEYDRAALERERPPRSPGERLARATCAECHGANLMGKAEHGSPPLVMVHAYSLEQFRTLLRTGMALGGRELGLMKTAAKLRYAFLSDEEIQSLYDYLHSATPDSDAP